MSSESSDVTLKDESSGAGEALAEPPSPDTETMVLARPAAAEVADTGAASLASVATLAPVASVTGDSDVVLDVKVCAVPGQVQDPPRQQEPQERTDEPEEQPPEGTEETQEQQEQQQTKPALAESPVLERKKESAVGQERKSVVFSEPEAEVHRSAEQPAPVTESVTSCATSTTSIDGGYQGDSEFDTGTPSEDPARPPPRLDVLTDSDFCSEGAAGTESEAEHRLTDDMESSGVYSDAESRRSVEPDREPIEAIVEAEETTLTPVRETAAELEQPSPTAPAPAAAAAPSPEPTPPVRRRDPIPSHVVRAREPPPKKEPIKMNHPLPRRNVQSKLRSMLEASPAAAEGAARRPARPARKGRWDAVMNRIEQNKSEEKSRPRREVKSRLYEGVTPAKGAQNGSRRSLSGRNSRTGSTHTLTGSRTSLRPAGSGSRSVSPTFSEVSSASSAGSAASRGSMHSRDSAKLAAKSRAGSIPSLVSGRTFIPALRLTPAGSAPTTVRSGSKQPPAASRTVPTTAARAALEAPSRRNPPLSNKTNIANNQGTGTKTTKPSTRPPTSGRSQKVQSKTATKDAKPVPIKGVGGPAAAAAAAAAAARHEVQVTQLEDQLAGQQRDLTAARDDLQHASRCFDAAMVMVNYLSNEYNPFQLTDEVKALQSRATELQLALDEAAATQRRLEETIEERERTRLQREDEIRAELSALTSSHETELETGRQQLEEVRTAWHQERLLLEQDLARQQEARDQDVRELSRQHQETLASVTAQWERELAQSQQRSQAEADSLRQRITQLEQLNGELSRREDELKTAMGQSSNTKIQVLSTRIKGQEEEIQSLNAVLELKQDEIAQLRRDQQELTRLRERVPQLEERCTKHRAKAEDLEAQLRQRAIAERQLSEENRRLQEYQDKEAKANKRLSMENEQLQYKLRNHSQSEGQGTPGVLSRSASFRSPRTPTFIARAYSESPHVTRGSPRSPLKGDPVRRRSRRSDPDESGSPPQVTAVVEKSDSISWVLDLDTSARGSSAEPDELADSLELRLGPRGASRSPPSASGGASESSDSEEAEREAERDGVFYHLAGPRSAPVAIAGCGPASLPTEHMRQIPESAEGTEI